MDGLKDGIGFFYGDVDRPTHSNMHQSDPWNQFHKKFVVLRVTRVLLEYEYKIMEYITRLFFVFTFLYSIAWWQNRISKKLLSIRNRFVDHPHNHRVKITSSPPSVYWFIDIATIIDSWLCTVYLSNPHFVVWSRSVLCVMSSWGHSDTIGIFHGTCNPQVMTLI